MDNLSRWFVSTQWLASHLDEPGVVVVDGSWHLPASGRSGRREYDARHIPGALFFDIDAIADTGNPLPHMLPTAEKFAAEVGALGIDETQRIVVYDALGLYSAPRVWWTFRVMGTGNVGLLEGGLPKWTAEGRPVSAEPVRRLPRTFRARYDRARVFNLQEVRDGLAARAIQVVDARPAARFLGEAPEPRPWVRTGRIPGSLNVPMAALVEDGRLKPPPALRAAFASAGVDLAKPIVTSCGSGVNAAALNLALEVLGVRGVGLYDGAWTEWGGNADMPVAVGRGEPVR